MRKPLVAMLALLLLPSIATLPPRAATPPGPYAVTDLGVFNPKIKAHTPMTSMKPARLSGMQAIARSSGRTAP